MALLQITESVAKHERVAAARPAPRREVVSAWTVRWVADVAAVMLAAAIVGTSAAHVEYAIVSLGALSVAGAYRRRISLSVLDDAPRFVAPLAVALMLVGASAVVVDVPASVFAQTLVSIALVVAGRTMSYAVIIEARRAGRLSEPTLIVGAGAIGIELHRQLIEHPEYGLRPVGIVDDVADEDGLPLVGSVDALDHIVESAGVQRVIVAFGPTGEQDMVATLRAAALLDVDVHVVPRFFELGLAPVGPDVEQVWGIPLYRVRRAALRERVWRMKRLLDVAVSAAALLVLSPILAAIALIVRLSSAGPVLFRQLRIGQDGHTIEVLKFRTLRVNVDSDITWSVTDDPRQTRIGKWLRRLSLDELPQLWNVLRGDMSLVGPRPERPLFVNRFSNQVTGYSDRHRLPVGLTGLAQVHGLRGDTSIEERARFDNFYIEHWSPYTDVKIMMRTVGAVVRDALSRS